MYTLETLVPDCVGKYITGPNGAVKLSNLINGRTYAKCWQALVYWIVNQFDMGNSANLAPIGVIIRGSGKNPSKFKFLATFLAKYNIEDKNGEEGIQEADVSSIRMNLASISKLAGVETNTFKIALSHMFRRLGEVLGAKKQVLIDFSIGSLIGDKGKVEFLFHDTTESTEKKVSGGHMRTRQWKPKTTANTKNLRKAYPVASAPSAMVPKPPPATEQEKEDSEALPNSSVVFRRKLRGISPLKFVREEVGAQALLIEKTGLDAITMNAIDYKQHVQPPAIRHYDEGMERQKEYEQEKTYTHSDLSDEDDEREKRDETRDIAVETAKQRIQRKIMNENNLPPVIDSFARTQAAPYSGERFYRSLSSKIASFFTPEAGIFSIDKTKGGLVANGFVAFQPDRVIQTEEERKAELALKRLGYAPERSFLDQRATDESLLRYQFYVEQQISDAAVAPIKELWIRNALWFLQTNVSAVEEARVEEMVREMLEEMKNDYRISVKRSILDYVLRNRNERSRLGIHIPPPSDVFDWGFGPVPEPPSAESREPIQRAFQNLSKNLYVNNPAMLSLLEIWDKYKKNILLDLPTSNQLPMTVDRFEEIQEAHLKKLRRIFTNEWGEEVERVFKAYARDNQLSDQNSTEFFESVAVLMSNQLRTIVTNSVDAYHDFFTQYKQSPIIQFEDPNAPTLCSIKDCVWIRSDKQQGLHVSDIDGSEEGDASPHNNPRPVFVQRLILGKTSRDNLQGIIFHIPLLELEKTIGRIFDNVLRGLQNIPQVDSRIFPIMESESRFLNLNVDDEAGETILKQKRDLMSVLDRSSREANKILTLYDEFSYLLDEDARLKDYLSQPRSLAEYKSQIMKYRDVAKKLRDETNTMVRTPIIMIDCSLVNERLIEVADSLAEQICVFLVNRNVDHNIAIGDRFKTVQATLLHKPLDTKELVEQVNFVQEFKNVNMHKLRAECMEAKAEILFLLEVGHLLGPDVLKHIGLTWSRLSGIKAAVEESEERLSNERSIMEKKLEDTCAAELAKLRAHAETVARFKKDADVKKINEYLAQIHTLKQTLEHCATEVEEIHEQQRKLDIAETDFYILEKTTEELKPFEEVWNLYSNSTKSYQHWMRGPVFKLDAAQVEQDVTRMYSSASRLQNQLGPEAPDVAAVAGNIKKELTAFKPHIPLLHILCNQGMRDRHWSNISDIVNFDLRPDKHTSLTRVLDMGIDKYLDKLLEISESASRQHSIEKALTSMQADWKPLELVVKKHRDSGTYILVGDSIEDIQSLLDDHIMKTQTMKGSPFAKPFAEDIRTWEAWLLTTQEIVEVWLKVQSMWMYLEPVFGSEDIMKQMAKEGHMFKVVDSHWHKLMTEVVADTKVESVTNIPHILGILKDARELLETIQSGLNQYLETKRLYFSRFFFLSNSDLLEILSETKDPLRVQPHLKKCFEGVHELEFKENLDIISMKSQEGEVVPMVRIISPKDAKGAVEKWLKEFEQVMRETIFDQADRSTRAFSQSPRSEWVTQWPGQIALCVNQIHWTHNAAGAIQKGRSALQEFADRSNEELHAVVAKVRGKLPKLARTTLGALIVLDVHNRDVVDSLIKAKVHNINSFEWSAQLRYYFEENTVKVRMITTSLAYGNEYLGNSSRLVITPLTDRCYRTLMGAIQLNFGGAPEGPAGTGKTETVKDLAKATATQCVVFNCSDGLDYLAMGKFFKGLASSGAWACFDEFNRIELEVLSVVAQQITTIHQAKEKRVDVFTFEGTELALQSRCSVFITMNPGYAGRAELPDNLKAQFRTVAMMVPDYALIAEISLYSFGFVDANPLSKKIVAVFKLCSEQLSSQDHYDYGMRAVKTVLSAAQRLKQIHPEEKEDVLVLRAIRDVNLPKFLSHDLPLFHGIAEDLFPGVELPSPNFGKLMEAIENQIGIMNLQPESGFIDKIIQIYETARVRHGFMIVGLPFSGKTKCYQVLARALEQMASEDPNSEKAVDVHIINPKAVTIGQLYGKFDPVSHDWTDGILPTKFRECAKDETGRRQWLLFDGPVDAIWIENMNTVLDDNRKLCLTSGQIVPMSSSMNMVFEVRDLAAASPATVSRCGMVYMEPGILGWRPLVKSWFNTFEGYHMDKKDFDRVSTLCDWLVPPCLRLLKSLNAYSTPVETNLVVSMCNIFQMLAVEFKNENFSDINGSQNVVKYIESIFLFALVWSIGAAVDLDGRVKFDKFLREVCLEVNHYKLSSHFPKQGTVYDYSYSTEKQSWVNWISLIDPKWKIAGGKNAKFSDILVPTGDTVCYNFLLSLHIDYRKPLLFVGTTGTGKSTYIEHMMRKLDHEHFTSLTVPFSAQSSATQTQFLIDDKLDRRKRGIFGPSQNKRMVVFIDDLNLPILEKYGASPPVELLRQFMDHGGWYDVKECTFRKIQDVQFAFAMGPTGGGRNPVTDRMLRHLSTISVAPFSDKALQLIYSTIVKWHMDTKGFSVEMQNMADRLVSATNDIFQMSVEHMLPTPGKSHYTFNMRDFSAVIQGICLSRGKEFTEPNSFIRLWVHEVHRVFGDRLVNDHDSEQFLKWVTSTCKKQFGTSFDDVCSDLDNNDDGKVDTLSEIRSLFFGDYVNRAQPRPYCEIKSDENLLNIWTQYLREYNDETIKPMKLVMFRFAVEHASRIARILKQGGNALLVGVGGAGKQSLTRLAAHVMGMEVIQVSISKVYSIEDWKEDLRKVLKQAGGKGEPTVFLFTDAQMSNPSFLEDVNSLLNSGDVPNLWGPEEMGEIIELVRTAAKRNPNIVEGTMAELFSFFVSRVRENLRIVLCMSPIGNAFRERLRMYPSLVNCCTIDWFQSWPTDALQAVAEEFLNEVDLEEKTRSACVDICMGMHEEASQVATSFMNEKSRQVYVTPTSYLELITNFQTVLGQQRDRTIKKQHRYQNGLDKLYATESEVKKMQIDLEDMQPVLIRTSEETENMLKIVVHEKEAAQKIREGVEAEEKIARHAAETAKTIEKECSEDLARAMPILEAAIAALDTLTNQEISELKSFVNPHPSIKLVMECLCIMKKVVPARRQDPATGKMITDYWEPSRKFVLSDPKLLRSLKQYDKDNIPKATIKQIRSFIQRPEFDLAKIKEKNKAAHSLCSWIYAIEAYDRVAKVIEPKKEKLALAQQEYAVVKKGLDLAQGELAKVERKISDLEDNLQAMTNKKQDLEHKIEQCNIKLERANKLLGGLGGEKERWTNEVRQMKESYVNITGDVLISSGVISYLGAFTSSYRESAIKKWCDACTIAKVPFSESFSLQQVLGDPVQTRGWVIDGLPNDNFSIDSAIIMNTSNRWPLMIDPQGQANSWIKKMEAGNKLITAKPSDNYARKMETAISLGYPFILENVDEEIDTSLETVLLKQTYKRNNVKTIRFGDSEIEYSDHFRFYITTKLRNPHYLPEVSTKVCLLNFMITPDGLEDQLLGIVVSKEKPDLEEQRNRLVLASASNSKKLKEIEDQILNVLEESKANVLDDENAIEVLSASKSLSDEIQEKQKITDQTEKEINLTRAGYVPVARHAAVLFFAISDLGFIDPMYQYSLAWFLKLFVNSIANSDFSHVLQTRIDTLNAYFRFSLFENVCRSLFESHKLLFSLLLCTRLQMSEDKINSSTWRFFLTGGQDLGDAFISNPDPTWISKSTWNGLCRLSKLPQFNDLVDTFQVDEWKSLYDSINPVVESYPGKWNDVSHFDKMMIMRYIRPDKLIASARVLVGKELGKEFVETPALNLIDAIRDANCVTPILFILSPGSDPMKNLDKYAIECNMIDKMDGLSLGQGQGPLATRMIEKAVIDGSWVVLQNCHLCPSWMPQLEAIVDHFDEKTVHPDFRLWLTSYPSANFPVLILQNGIKLTTQAPMGLKANLLASYNREPIMHDTFYTSCEKTDELRTLTFAVSFFHAIVQERREFGPLGFNIPYGFNETDQNISIRQLHMFLDTNDEIPYKALRYLMGECNYGGRVTDERDRIMLLATLDKFFNPKVHEQDFKFDDAGIYFAPHVGEVSTYIEYIKALPLIAHPTIFGMHANADISKDRKESNDFLRSLLITEDTSSSGSDDTQSVVMAVTADILKKLPNNFDIDKIQAKFPVSYSDSMHTVLVQECIRYNRLTDLIRSTCNELRRALNGWVVMSAQIEELANDIYKGLLPTLWKPASYPSLKPIGSYFLDLLQRLEFLNTWTETEEPIVVWLPGIFFTHSFLTGALQNFARRHKIAIDQVEFDFEFLGEGAEIDPTLEKPEDGVYVQGLFLEGAKWDFKNNILVDSDPKVIYASSPVIWLRPKPTSELTKYDDYDCPMYRTSDRRGVLSTTGHSTNFLMSVRFPTNKPQNYWILRGVALLTMLDD